MTTTQKQADFIPANRRISVCAKRFYAALQFISTEETRYYLNGVFIEPHKDGGVTMTATDGWTMACVRDKTALFEGDGGWICPVPKGPFTNALKRKDAGTLHFVGSTAYLTDSLIGAAATDTEFDPTQITPLHNAIAYAKPIDGRYPDWRAVVPKDFNKQAEQMSFDVTLLDRFTKAITPLQDSKKHVGINLVTPPDEQSPIVIRADLVPDFFGILMPRRASSDQATIPYWMHLPAKQERKPKPANDAEAELVKSGRSAA
ncbi:hypothetical protein [Thalassospira sp.]|uniref:hypothetical protein n=1 Tax=Thalassospira sp. TaxID=1912094 RepID=UPI000C66A21F|nr:hypothetical protein [Thalassospira sp.]MBC05689.1 hypothetical protein [Thalassospira sp.]|tara:strand:- start:6011 stop:6790 length:780 start_codon:yes stop_codon:yes gene_type:complete